MRLRLEPPIDNDLLTVLTDMILVKTQALFYSGLTVGLLTGICLGVPVGLTLAWILG